MNNNQIIPQPKAEPERKAIISLILGIIGVILPAGVFFIGVIAAGVGGFSTLAIPIGISFITLVSPLTMLITLMGIILGVKGLKSTKKKFAGIGIVLCGLIFIMGILFLLFFFEEARKMIGI